MLRYTIQTVVMLGDVLFLLALCFVTVFSVKHPPLLLVVVPVVSLSIYSWYKQGAFMAWKKNTRQLFLERAKQLGL